MPNTLCYPAHQFFQDQMQQLASEKVFLASFETEMNFEWKYLRSVSPYDGLVSVKVKLRPRCLINSLVFVLIFRRVN